MLEQTGQAEQATLKPLQAVIDEHIIAVLKAVGGNRTKAAKALKIDRTTLYNHLRRINGARPYHQGAAMTAKFGA